ncbi:SRPBCC family protein [Alkalicoccobacillus gibsonii]|uniref:SRPBCC family protein n=1 Tax=Alkalicoccobacillus gibsonii TaxID=79881 RepID=UPI001933642A|nr:SRPBCC family protein [Alkalicoccobacillus gibsonii]MBM0066838.1 SRPBCC family protein [Alkalicoccobacillus gibsonii]
MKEMICFTFEAMIDVPVDVVFACLNEDKHVLQWNDFIVENVYDGDEQDLKEGSIFITKQKVGKKIIELEGEYSKYNPPHAAEVKTNTKEGIGFTRYQLIDKGGQTHFKVEVAMIPRNMYYSILTKTFKWSFKLMYTEQFEKFVEYTRMQYKMSKDIPVELTP